MAQFKKDKHSICKINSRQSTPANLDADLGKICQRIWTSKWLLAQLKFRLFWEI